MRFYTFIAFMLLMEMHNRSYMKRPPKSIPYSIRTTKLCASKFHHIKRVINFSGSLFWTNRNQIKLVLFFIKQYRIRYADAYFRYYYYYCLCCTYAYVHASDIHTPFTPIVITESSIQELYFSLSQSLIFSRGF